MAYNNSFRWRWQKITKISLSSANRQIRREGGCLLWCLLATCLIDIKFLVIYSNYPLIFLHVIHSIIIIVLNLIISSERLTKNFVWHENNLLKPEFEIIILFYFLPFRIGLCGFDNPLRDAKTTEVKRQIGQVRNSKKWQQ